MFISKKSDSKTRSIIAEKVENYIKNKLSIYLKQVTVTSVCATNKISNFMKQKLKTSKDKQTNVQISLGTINTFLSVMSRTTRQENNNDIECI